MAKINKPVNEAKQNESRTNVQSILGIGNFNAMTSSEYSVYNNQLNKENDSKSSGIYNHDILY